MQWLLGKWLVPVKNKQPCAFKNVPYQHWKDHNLAAQASKPEDLEQLLQEVYRYGYNIAVWCKASNLLGIDVDDPQAAQTVLEVLRKLGIDNTYIESTPRGNLHILYEVDAALAQELDSNPPPKLGKVELLWDHLLTIYGATVPQYIINNVPPAKLTLEQYKQLCSELQAALGQKEEKKEEIVVEAREGRLQYDPEILAQRLAEKLRDYYKPGFRHRIVVAILGAMWQYGYDAETRVRTIEKFVHLMQDEEADERIYQAKYHDERRLEQLLQRGKRFAVEEYLIKSGLEPALAMEIGRKIRAAVQPFVVLGVKHVQQMRLVLYPNEERARVELPFNITVELRNPFRRTEEGFEFNVRELEHKLLYFKAMLSSRARDWLRTHTKDLLAKAEIEIEDVRYEILRVIDIEGVLREKADLQEFLLRRYPIIDPKRYRIYFLGERLRDIAQRFGTNMRALGVRIRRTSIMLCGKKVDVYEIPFSEFGDIIVDIVKRKAEQQGGGNV